MFWCICILSFYNIDIVSNNDIVSNIDIDLQRWRHITGCVFYFIHRNIC